MNEAALEAFAAGHLQRAIESFQKAVAAEPANWEVRQGLGLAYLLQGRKVEAEGAFRAAIEVAPNAAEAHMRLGKLMNALKLFAQAAGSFRRAIEDAPSLARPHLLLGEALCKLGKNEESEEEVRRGLALDPLSADGHWMLGQRLRELGQFDEALASLEHATNLDPGRLPSYFQYLVSGRKLTRIDSELIERMSALLKESGLSPEDQCALHYALGKAHDDLANYERAFRHYEEANRLAGSKLQSLHGPFDPVAYARRTSMMCSTFTPDFFAGKAAFGVDSELPIFIVGMVRSGTTLVEHLLSNHPKIAAGGELFFWKDRAAALFRAVTSPTGSAIALEAAAEYRRILRSIGPKMLRVTDKMPINFMSLGAIHTLFPKARIIHCRRHPADTCLSIYMTPFPSGPPDFAHDLGSIAFAYSDYLRLMSHWRAVIPAGRLMEIDYEDLVENPERVTRAMVEFCGLEWDEACGRPENNQRAVITPSQWQVRQPIYKSSMGRWRHYEPWLGPLQNLLSEG